MPEEPIRRRSDATLPNRSTFPLTTSYSKPFRLIAWPNKSSCHEQTFSLMFTAHPLLSSVVSTQYGYRKLQTPKHFGPKNTCTKRRRPVPECLKILWLSGHFRPITAIIICKVISYKCPDNSVRILWVQSILGPMCPGSKVLPNYFSLWCMKSLTISTKWNFSCHQFLLQISAKVVQSYFNVWCKQ